MPSILISGASVAGPALAIPLARAGWDVTVVERAQELRTEGQNVDVRGAARQVLGRLGIEDAVRAANTGEEGTELVADDGQVVASFAVRDGEQDGPTAELEVLRGQLARILCDAAPEGVRWRFGDHVAALEDRGEGVHVRFAGGDEARFDVLAVAEGRRSATRDLVFDDVGLEPLGASIAYATIPRAQDDTRTWRWLNTTGGRQVHLRPDDVGTTRAMLAFRPEGEGLDGRTPDEQVALLRDVFADVGWAAPRILAALDPETLYAEDLTQVVAPRWSAGRVVLLGDAAHCVTPLGGGGTSLALIDAHVLAQELQRAAPAAAFAAYEAFMRPHADRARKLPPGFPAVSFPSSRLGVRLLRAGGKVAEKLAPLLPEPASGLEEIELEPPRG